MAIATAEGSRRRAVRQAPEMRFGSRDRAREFRRARRHSVLVLALKIVLPIGAAGIVSLYLVPAFLTKSIDDGKGTASAKGITIQAGALKMLQPRVKGINDKQDHYEFLADTATQQAKDADVMYLEKVRGKVVSPDGKISTLTAPDGIHNNKTDEMTFNNGVVVTREPAMRGVFKTATAYMKQQMVISKTPVVVYMHDSTIHADGMTMYWGESRAIFEGNVRTHLERTPPAAAPETAAKEQLSASAQQAPSSQPLGRTGN
jgi:lipopolysaccharide export system protein LptC